MTTSEAGGFIQPMLLSPPPSSAHSSSTATVRFPSPRSHPLKSGGPKEGAFRRYMDENMKSVTRRFAKRTGAEPKSRFDNEQGYESFKEVARDIEKLLDVVWVTGTPNLQIPYLMSLSLLTADTIEGFPASPRTMFRLLHKLDHAFASLIQQRDVETGEPLPGFDTGRKVNTTEKVRIKSLIERTRLSVFNVMASGEFEEEGFDDEDEIIDFDAEPSTDQSDWDMESTKVYDKTMMELGETIGGSPIGIVTDD